MNLLLAKSIKKDNLNPNNQYCTLRSHLRLTFVAAKTIYELTGKRQIEAIGLDSKDYLIRYKTIFLLAAAIHDLGKANNHFYEMVNNEAGGQSIRHEWVLYLLLRFSPLGKWLKKCFPMETREEDFNCLVWAVTGHHRKQQGKEVNDYGQNMELLIDPAEYDFFEILKWIAGIEEFALPSIDFSCSDLLNSKVFSFGTIRDFIALPGGEGLRSKILELCDEFEPDGEEEALFVKSAFMASVRSSLMAADAAASAMGEAYLQEDVEEETSRRLSVYLANLPDVIDYQKIITRKETELKTASHDDLALSRRKFQNQTAESQSRITLCIAGCGSGKTFAAWKWALNHCQKDGNRLFFCYPTTGTASEGFMDYLIDNGDLIHSRSKIDNKLLERLRGRKKNEDDLDVDNVIKSLEFWNSRIACCTVDTVLKMLVGSYSGHLVWPALAQAHFIFDEIHSYDNTLFERLLQFLENIKGVKVLLLTASLPDERLKRLRKVVKKNKINGIPEKIEIINGPEKWEKVLRYQKIQSSLDPIDLVLEKYQKGQKILWICNTVDRAMKTREEIVSRLKETDNYGNFNENNILIYHSRFKYKDRVKRHEDCINAFKSREPVICITTQVAEMSLDISADFLVTDSAPIPALIQRLGRLNRKALFDDPKPFLVIIPADDQGKTLTLPYSSHDDNWLKKTSMWIDLLGDNALSQKDLTDFWLQVGETGLPADQTSDCALPWIAPGPWMSESNLRDPSVAVCNVLLCEDIDSVKRDGPGEYLIPMPKCSKSLDKCDKYNCYIAKNGGVIFYDEKIGGKWINEKNEKETPDGIKEIQIF
ncbi:MAG: CRISPR-associated helicase Cas3' [Planctomycetia bacterium]|nr:CRISPR-associated helicase Cas3' [Planctomycetia bacterium]